MRNRLAVSTLLAGALLGAAGLAWACTASAYVQISPRSGPAGLVVTMSGGQFNSGPVSIRWNSVDGREIGTAQGSNFSVPVRIPSDAPAGVHYVVAVQTDTLGFTYKTSAAFEVSAASSTGPSGSTETGPSTTSGRISAGGSEPASGTAPGGTQSGAPAGGSSPSGQPAPAGTQPARAPSAGAQVPGGFSLQSPGQEQAVSPGNVQAPAPQAGPARDAQRAAGAQAAPSPRTGATATGAAEAGPVQAPGIPAAVEEPAAVPGSAAALAGDLWAGFDEGFDSGRARTALGADGAEGGGAAAMLGAVMLSAGLVALVAGFGFSEFSSRRRRRATR